MSNQHKKWTKNDTDFLILNYYDMHLKEIAETLGFSENTIYVKAKKLNLKAKKNFWSEEEMMFLKDNYMFKTYIELAKDLGKSQSSIAEQLKKLGLRGKKSKCTNWSDEEKQFLKDNIENLTYSQISKKLNRTIQSIVRKANDLGYVDMYSKYRSKLKKNQINYILANYDIMTDKQLGVKFGVSETAIRDVRKKFNIKKTGNEVSGPTSIELFVINFLKEMNIDFIFNEYLGEYKPDFQITGTKILIEANGDYFHCNPYIYCDGPKDDIQIKNVLKDYYKKCYYLSKGYTILEIWEKEINDSPDHIKNKISAVLARNC